MALLLIVIAGAWLRAHRIGDRSLWYDEGATYWFAAQSWHDLWGPAARLETSPPLYYSLQKSWLVFGESPAALRSLPALFGVLTIFAAFALGRTSCGTAAGLMTAAIAGCSAVHIHYSQEARTYSWLVLLLTIALWALAHLFMHPSQASQPLLPFASKRFAPHGSSPRSAAFAWAAYVLAIIAAIYSHNTAVLFPLLATAAATVFWMMAARRNAGFALNWVVVHLVILVAYSWWLPTLLWQAQHYTDTYWRGAWTPALTWDHFKNVVLQVYGAGHDSRLSMLAALALPGLAILGVPALRKRPPVLALLLIIAAGLPLLAAGLSFWRPVFGARFLLWGTVPLFALSAAGASWLRPRWLGYSAIALVLAVQLVSVRSYYASEGIDGWDEAAAYVKQHERTGDVLLFANNVADAAFRYYYRPEDGIAPRYALEWAERRDPDRLRPAHAALPEIHLDDLAKSLGAYRRIWYISRWPPEQVAPPEALMRLARVAGVKVFRGDIHVRLLVPQSM